MEINLVVVGIVILGSIILGVIGFKYLQGDFSKPFNYEQEGRNKCSSL